MRETAAALRKPCRLPDLGHLHGECPIHSRERARSSVHLLQQCRLASIAMMIQQSVVVLQVFVQAHIHGARSCERARVACRRV